MIHRYKQGDLHIVLDINSGAVHVVDELAFNMLGLLTPPLKKNLPHDLPGSLSGYENDEIHDTYNELYELYLSGELFSEDDYQSIGKLTEISPVKALCLHIAHDCNMRCEYCFASTGEYHGGRSLMSEEVGFKAIDYLIEKSTGRRNLEVDFFGGEPLMNFEVVKKVVKYARSKEELHDKVFRFTITTNGLLLDDDKTDFINSEMSNVVLSIDGRKEVNDRVRKRVDGSSTYDNIVGKFKSLVDKRGDKPYYARGTFTKYNLDFVDDVLALSKLGFDQISVEPVVADIKEPYAITTADLEKINREYEKLADIMVDLQDNRDWFNFFHYMIDLEQGPCAIKRLRGCGCGNEYVAVTPEGDVYPCHQFVGHSEWKMGSVFDGSIDMKMKKMFADSTVYGKEECKNCWAKFYCSGGCNANAMIYNGDIKKPHQISCELEKKRIECALYIKAKTI